MDTANNPRRAVESVEKEPVVMLGFFPSRLLLNESLYLLLILVVDPFVDKPDSTTSG